MRLFRFFSGFGLAVACLLLLLVLTWLSTLEQPAKGLYEVQKRYYDAEAWYVIPDLDFLYLPDKPWLPFIGGKQIIIPLPGAYLVSAILFVNLVLGGLIRIRKGWRYSGVIIAHFSMVSLLVAGFVSHHYSKEGIMFVMQGNESDYARSYYDYTIEIFEITDGEMGKPYVVPAEPLQALDKDDELTVELPELPFDLEVTGWVENAQVVKPTEENPEAVDGLMLREFEPIDIQEENSSGCYVKIIPKEGEASPSNLLLGGGFKNPEEKRPNAFTPNTETITATVNGKIYGFRKVREIWPMPFRVHLDESIGNYYPGTMKASFFQSKITRLADDAESKFTIRMNEPMRYGGYTLYQARWIKADPPVSGFAIVRNPSDQWPKWSTYIASFGLLIHFGMKLFGFIGRTEKKPTSPQQA